MEPKLKFRGGTTVLAHADLVSFLHSKDTRILHMPYDSSTWQELKNLSRVEEESKLLQELRSRGIIVPSDGKEDYIFLKRENPQILHALIMLTNRCNMSCEYCYTESNMHVKEGSLDGSQWSAIFDAIRIPSKFPSQNISLTGGEPTIHPDFSDILDALSGRYKIEVSSNGLRLRKGVLESLVACEGLNLVSISIDSVRPKEDEVMRGTGTYSPRMKNLKILYSMGLPLCIGSVISHITLPSLEETTQFFLSEFPGIKIKYVPITKMGKALKLSKELFLTREDAEKYVKSVMKMREQFKDRILTDPSSFEEEKAELRWSGRCSSMKYDSERTLFLNPVTNKVSERCNAAYGVVSISPDGRLRPCLRADSFYTSILSQTQKETLMPNIVGLSSREIGELPFWRIVKREAEFNPAHTCALEAGMGGEYGYD
ncbi:MAG: radical SAM protein [Nanoarchaeota archaeon]|nr:radical SAM protein [Nanoarchaeota archaeon]